MERYNPNELLHMVDPKNEEERIAISRAINRMKAQQQEIRLLSMEITELRESNQALKDYAENADADKDEQAGRIMRMENMLYQAKDMLQMGVDYLNHDKPFDPLGSMKIAIKAIDALLGGKEDV